MNPDRGVRRSAPRTPEESALILRAKDKLKTVVGWTEPVAFAWLRSTAMHRRERIAVFAEMALRCPANRSRLLVLRYVRPHSPRT
jgi:hypothetical protein